MRARGGGEAGAKLTTVSVVLRRNIINIKIFLILILLTFTPSEQMILQWELRQVELTRPPAHT